MRVFIGIQLTKKLQRKITSWQEKYQQTFVISGVRFIEQENLHITLLPPWNVGNPEEIVSMLEKEKFAGQFDLLFTKIVTKPLRHTQYIWIYGSTSEMLQNLRLQLAAMLHRPLEKREYLLHTTIARIQKHAKYIPVEESINWKMKVKSFVLFASHLSSQGAEYEVIKEFALP